MLGCRQIGMENQHKLLFVRKKISNFASAFGGNVASEERKQGVFGKGI